MKKQKPMIKKKRRKYSIFYLLKGNAKNYRNKLVKEVGPTFGERYVFDSKLPAHITLKVPFETNDIKNIEENLKEFVKNHKESKIKIIEFGHFRRFVAFLKFEFSKNALSIQKDLINSLNKIKDISISKTDKQWHPHATISYGNTKKSFNGIWEHLKKLKRPYFEIMFDNITIMKKSGKYWKIHKKFKLK